MHTVVDLYIDCEKRGISDALKQPDNQWFGVYTNIWSPAPKRLINTL